MLTAVTYSLYPTPAQQVLLAKHFGCVRWVYNMGLATKTTAWAERQENLSAFDLMKRLPGLKKAEETAWLSEVNAQSLQVALINVDKAFTNFFRKQADFPKFKSKFSKQSFQVPQEGKVGSDFVKIPKVGKLKAKISRQLPGKLKFITISKTTTGKYFAACLCDDGLEPPKKKPIKAATTIGIDLGLKHFATLSTGEKVDNPRHLRSALKCLRRKHRRLSARVKGSANRNKARQRVALAHEKVANKRKDFLHKLTTRLVRENQTDTFAIEDLAVSNMQQNRRLALSISDAGWFEFRRQLEYKASKLGKNVLVIGRFEPSSKRCSNCGQTNQALTLKDREWTCPCGTHHDRDLNAARNIKCFALHPQSVRPGRPESTPVESR